MSYRVLGLSGHVNLHDDKSRHREDDVVDEDDPDHQVHPLFPLESPCVGAL